MPNSKDGRKGQSIDQKSVSRRQVLGSVGAGSVAFGGVSGSALAGGGHERPDDALVEEMERKKSEFQSGEAVKKIAKTQARPLVAKLASRGLIQTDQSEPVIPTEPVPMEQYTETDEGVVVTGDITDAGVSARIQYKMQIGDTRLLVAALPHQDVQYAVIGKGENSTIVDQDGNGEITIKGDFTAQNCMVGSVCYWRGGLYAAVERELYCCYDSQGEVSSCYWGDWGYVGCNGADNGPCCEFCNSC